MGNGLMSGKHRTLIFGLFWIALFSTTAKAGFVLVTSRTSLNATGQFNLANLGPAGTDLPISTQLTANTGEVATISQAAGSPSRVDQSAATFGWSGNFLPGQALIWTRYGGPTTFDFGTTKLSSFGYQIQPDVYTRFTAYISVLDANNIEIARFTRDGGSNANADGSALFIGIAATDSASYFSKIRFGIQTGGNTLNFAYNSPSFAAVPEPGTVVLGVISAFALIYVKKRRRISNQSA